MTPRSRNNLILMAALIALAALMTYVRDLHVAAVLPPAATTTPATASSTEAASTTELPGPVHPITPAHTPAPSPKPAPAMITPADNGTTVHEPLGSRFGIAMGDTLEWTLDLNPQGIITRVRNIATLRGEQGVYTATARGTTKLTATGAPYCNDGEACPQFLEHVEVTIVVD